MYKVLCDLLPKSFGLKHWTSKRRHLAPGCYPKYDGIHVADFQYKDEDLRFTKFLDIAEDIRRLWREKEARPTYFVEVKATSANKDSVKISLGRKQQGHVSG
jgi:hypothetical protein